MWMNEGFETGLVSVIVPTYNRAAYIIDALESVRLQNYRPIEVIVIDDGSTDNTKDLVMAWKEKFSDDPQFTCQYYFQKNTGVGAARNAALRHSKGEYIQFLDSDDLLHKERFDRVVKVFKETSCEYVETGFEGFCSICGAAYEKHYGHTKTDPITLLLTGRLWPNTLRPMYRRNLIVRTGPWNEEMVTLQDYEFAIRALVQNTRCKSIHDILASARRDSSGRMSDIIQTKEGRKLRIYCEELLSGRVKKLEDIPLESKRAFASRIYVLGTRCNAEGWISLGKKCYDTAESLNIELDNRTKLKRMICRMGRPGGILYQALMKMKKKLSDESGDDSLQHHCC